MIILFLWREGGRAKEGEREGEGEFNNIWELLLHNAIHCACRLRETGVGRCYAVWQVAGLNCTTHFAKADLIANGDVNKYFNMLYNFLSRYQV